jgi:hypothetical protein
MTRESLTTLGSENFIGVRADLLATAWAIYDLSMQQYKFSPVWISFLILSTGEFVLYYNLPTSPTPDIWKAEIQKMLGTNYLIGIGTIYVSIKCP